MRVRDRKLLILTSAVWALYRTRIIEHVADQRGGSWRSSLRQSSGSEPERCAALRTELERAWCVANSYRQDQPPIPLSVIRDRFSDLIPATKDAKISFDRRTTLQQLEPWFAELRSQLADIIRSSQSTELGLPDDMIDKDVLDLPSAIFVCSKCNEVLLPDAALCHRCVDLEAGPASEGFGILSSMSKALLAYEIIDRCFLAEETTQAELVARKDFFLLPTEVAGDDTARRRSARVSTQAERIFRRHTFLDLVRLKHNDRLDDRR